MATRPSYNTGVGFFTLNGKLYDANGVEFIMRGTNTCHYDESWASCTSNCGIPNSKANTNRIFLPMWASQSWTPVAAVLQNQINANIIPVATINATTSDWGTTTLCTESATPFNNAVSQWVARAAQMKPFERWVIVNIANEWGAGINGNMVATKDAYLSAIAQLRAAGYLNTLVIDAGGCGTNPTFFLQHGQTLYDADPQHNILFSWHTYDTNISALTSYTASLKATGLPIIFGEFGPGTLTDPTNPLNGQFVSPAQVIAAAEGAGFGWLSWAYDDGTGNGWFGLTNAKAFRLTNGVPTAGAYPNNTDLTIFGNDVILSPHGTFATATQASIFGVGPSPDVDGATASVAPTVISSKLSAAPHIYPAAGAYTGARTVRLTGYSSGSIIRYTTDGSVPTLASTRYAAPFTVSTTSTVRAVAWVQNKRPSRISYAAYVVN